MYVSQPARSETKGLALMFEQDDFALSPSSEREPRLLDAHLGYVILLARTGATRFGPPLTAERDRDGQAMFVDPVPPRVHRFQAGLETELEFWSISSPGLQVLAGSGWCELVLHKLHN